MPPHAPTPRDPYGNPIQPKPPTAAEREVARREAAQRAQERQEAEHKAEVEKDRAAEEERRAAALLAEEQQFHDRIMTAVYIGLAIAAVFVGSRLLKR